MRWLLILSGFLKIGFYQEWGSTYKDMCPLDLKSHASTTRPSWSDWAEFFFIFYYYYFFGIYLFWYCYELYVVWVFKSFFKSYQSRSIIIHKVLAPLHLIDLDKVAVLFYIDKSLREQLSKVLSQHLEVLYHSIVKTKQGDDNLKKFSI